MHALALSLALLVAAPRAGALQSSPRLSEPSFPGDAVVRAAFERLDEEGRREAAAWLALEARHLGTFQRKLVEHALSSSDRDPGFWPRAGETPVFDPEVHAPRQPIPRRRLDWSAPEAVSLRERVARIRGGPRPPAGWRYDWASGGVVRTGAEDDPERVLEGALAGLPPDHDLARALVLRLLDGGEEREALAAFAHAYSDREGRVYPGVTLYDAWSSGMEMEMPDVDVLGVVHTVLDEWRRWRAPVPASRHAELYAVVGDLFQDARRYRGLRAALADVYLQAEPALADGYASNLDRFHALWDIHESDPAALAGVLPDAEGWREFLAEWVRRCAAEPELLARGRARREALATSERAVRERLAWVLRELGAFDSPAPDGDRGGEDQE